MYAYMEAEAAVLDGGWRSDTCSQYKRTEVKACSSKIFLSKHAVNAGFQCENYLTLSHSTELNDALPFERSGPGFNRTFTVD